MTLCVELANDPDVKGGAQWTKAGIVTIRAGREE
jgi:hypothetical protein